MNVEMICATCGGTNVIRDAWAVWDTTAQQWTQSAVFDHAQYDDCERGTTIEERPLDPPTAS